GLNEAPLRHLSSATSFHFGVSIRVFCSQKEEMGSKLRGIQAGVYGGGHQKVSSGNAGSYQTSEPIFGARFPCKACPCAGRETAQAFGMDEI
ncbi:MAG: hypothetical protein ACE5HO_16125, partial [bacterium]